MNKHYRAEVNYGLYGHMNIKIVFNKFKLVKEKIMEQVYRIGIDHGYGNIKTAHHIFES